MMPEATNINTNAKIELGDNSQHLSNNCWIIMVFGQHRVWHLQHTMIR
jgi:hypothetical protein